MFNISKIKKNVIIKSINEIINFKNYHGKNDGKFELMLTEALNKLSIFIMVFIFICLVCGWYEKLVLGIFLLIISLMAARFYSDRNQLIQDKIDAKGISENIKSAKNSLNEVEMKLVKPSDYLKITIEVENEKKYKLIEYKIDDYESSQKIPMES